MGEASRDALREIIAGDDDAVELLLDVLIWRGYDHVWGSKVVPIVARRVHAFAKHCWDNHNWELEQYT